MKYLRLLNNNHLIHNLTTKNYEIIATALAVAMIALSPVVAAFGQASREQLFDCEYYGDTMHCNLLLNDLQGFEASGNSTLVHPITNNETKYVDGKIGKALEMHSEYRESIEMMNVPEINAKQFSVSFWLKNIQTEPYGHIISHSNKHQTAGWLFDSFGSGDANGQPISVMRFGVFNSNGTLFSPADIRVPTDRFMHIVGTFDGSKVKVYQDGKLLGVKQFTGNYTLDPGVPLRIASAAYCSSCNRWSGDIDDIRIYNRTLSEAEVDELSDLSSGVADGMVGYWKLDGNTADSLGKNNGASNTIVTSMKFAPDGRLFFDEKNTGEIRIMTPDHKILESPFSTIDDLYVSWEQGMLGLTLDPEFEQNHYVYVYYTALVGAQDGQQDKVINRVVRFTEKNNIGTDKKILLDNIPASRGFHSGGALAFGPDDKLYITVGDATEHIFAQDPSIVIGKVLRINRDGTIPEDNPYANLPVYTLGHRNMYGIAFGKDGTGVVTENGDFHYDEINLIQKGGNYGFPTLQPPNLPPERTNNSSIKPLRTYWDTIAPTQVIYYDGNAVPELKGMYIFGSFTGDIYGVRLSDDKKKIVEEIKVNLGLFPFVPVVSIAQSPDGKIFFGGYQLYTLDSISKMRRNVYEVPIDAPSAIDITDLRLFPDQKKVEIDANVNDTLAQRSTLTIKIPKAIVDNITRVAIEGQSQVSTFDAKFDDSNANFTSVVITLGPMAANSNLKLAFTSVAGTTIVPEFHAATLVVATVFAATIAAGIVSKRKGVL